MKFRFKSFSFMIRKAVQETAFSEGWEFIHSGKTVQGYVDIGFDSDTGLMCAYPVSVYEAVDHIDVLRLISAFAPNKKDILDRIEQLETEVGNLLAENSSSKEEPNEDRYIAYDERGPLVIGNYQDGYPDILVHNATSVSVMTQEQAEQLIMDTKDYTTRKGFTWGQRIQLYRLEEIT